MPHCDEGWISEEIGILMTKYVGNGTIFDCVANLHMLINGSLETFDSEQRIEECATVVKFYIDNWVAGTYPKARKYEAAVLILLHAVYDEYIEYYKNRATKCR